MNTGSLSVPKSSQSNARVTVNGLMWTTKCGTMVTVARYLAGTWVAALSRKLMSTRVRYGLPSPTG
jgi:hypothetical protein